MVEVFNFVKVIIIALFLILIFGILAGVPSGAIDNWKDQAWADDYPFLTFIISGANVWLFFGLVIGILAGIVYGVQVWGNNGA